MTAHTDLIPPTDCEMPPASFPDEEALVSNGILRRYLAVTLEWPERRAMSAMIVVGRPADGNAAMDLVALRHFDAELPSTICVDRIRIESPGSGIFRFSL